MGRGWVFVFLAGCAVSHPPDDFADDAGDADSDDDVDSDVDSDLDSDVDSDLDCHPVFTDCPRSEPREGSACEIRTEGDCFFLSEGCQRTYACEECRWILIRRVGCG